MKKDNSKTTPEDPAGIQPAETVQEPCNTAVQALQNALKIGNAIVGIGRVDFPLTASKAKELEALGLVRIIGTWS